MIFRERVAVAFRLRLNPGIVHEDVEMSPCAKDIIEHPKRGSLIADIGLYDPVLIGWTTDMARYIAELVENVFGGLSRAVVIDGDGCAFLSKANGDCTTDSAGCSRHQGAPALKPFH
jgi:hypothetical protein